jgi:hypothetical protein
VVHQDAGRHQVIGERVVHDVAGARTVRPQHAVEAAVVLLAAGGLVDRPWRLEDGRELSHLAGEQTAERRVLGLQLDQLGLAGERELRERPAAADAARVDPLQGLGVIRRLRLGVQHLLGQARHQRLLARRRVLRLLLVEIRAGHAVPPFECPQHTGRRGELDVVVVRQQGAPSALPFTASCLGLKSWMAGPSRPSPAMTRIVRRRSPHASQRLRRR